MSISWNSASIVVASGKECDDDSGEAGGAVVVDSEPNATLTPGVLGLAGSFERTRLARLFGARCFACGLAVLALYSLCRETASALVGSSFAATNLCSATSTSLAALSTSSGVPLRSAYLNLYLSASYSLNVSSKPPLTSAKGLPGHLR